MRFLIKLLIAALVIVFCTSIGKKLPQLASLIAVMPLTGLIVLVWLYSDNSGNYDLMAEYTKAALFGILPTMLFFLTCYVCFHKRLSLTIALSAGFVVWIIAALIHQWLFK
jgi:uncharacterized membrane protein (GlpM family)